MNIPMSVQADALHMILPATEIESIPILANALAILIGAALGAGLGARIT